MTSDCPRTLTLSFTQAQAAQVALGLEALPALVFDQAAAPDGGIDMAREDPAYPIRCHLYSENAQALRQARAVIEAIAEMVGFAVPEMHVADLPARNWVQATQESLPPITVGPFTLRGSHSPPPPKGQYDLKVEAGLAFGTGHHETTRGCLALLLDVLAQRRPLRILDMGCGSGVLAMAVAKAVPEARGVGIELDADSVEVARENLRLNRVAGQIQVVEGRRPDLAGGTYDLIFANILAQPLISLAPGLSQVAEPGADLLLAGLLIDQEAEVLAAYRDQGWVRIGGFHDGLWAMVRLLKADSKSVAVQAMQGSSAHAVQVRQTP